MYSGSSAARRSLGAFVIALLGLACGPAQAQTLYRWADREGVRHLTKDAPTGAVYERIEAPDDLDWRSPPLMPRALAGDGDSTRDLYRNAAVSVYALVVREKDGSTSYGSAVAVSEEDALTNCHVLGFARDNIVLLASVRDPPEDVTVVASDVSHDRCVVRTQHLKLHPVAGVRAWDSLEVGETVYAIGNPRGLRQTFSDGLVSGKREKLEVAGAVAAEASQRLVQTTAAISPGSSGGGLFDRAGNLIGITSLTLLGAQNINFAVPAEDYWR